MCSRRETFTMQFRSANGLPLVHHQAVTWTNADINQSTGTVFRYFLFEIPIFISGTAFKIRRLQTFVEFSRCQSFYILKWKFIVVECVFVVVLFIFHKGTISPAYLSFAQPSPIMTNLIIHDVYNARMAETLLATANYVWPSAVDTLPVVKT